MLFWRALARLPGCLRWVPTRPDTSVGRILKKTAVRAVTFHLLGNGCCVLLCSCVVWYSFFFWMCVCILHKEGKEVRNTTYISLVLAVVPRDPFVAFWGFSFAPVTVSCRFISKSISRNLSGNGVLLFWRRSWGKNTWVQQIPCQSAPGSELHQWRCSSRVNQEVMACVCAAQNRFPLVKPKCLCWFSSSLGMLSICFSAEVFSEQTPGHIRTEGVVVILRLGQKSSGL